MDTGTQILFIWRGEGRVAELKAALSSFLVSEKCEASSLVSWRHEIYGTFSMVFQSTQRGDGACFSFDCELLPELNDPGFERPPQPPIAIYHLARKIFSTFDADECFAGTVSDGVWGFDFDDPLIDRIFRFSKRGPQRLVKPYEEHRPVSFEDVRVDPVTGRPNWLLG